MPAHPCLGNICRWLLMLFWLKNWCHNCSVGYGLQQSAAQGESLTDLHIHLMPTINYVNDEYPLSIYISEIRNYEHASSMAIETLTPVCIQLSHSLGQKITILFPRPKFSHGRQNTLHLIACFRDDVWWVHCQDCRNWDFAPS